MKKGKLSYMLRGGQRRRCESSAPPKKIDAGVWEVSNTATAQELRPTRDAVLWHRPGRYRMYLVPVETERYG